MDGWLWIGYGSAILLLRRQLGDLSIALTRACGIEADFDQLLRYGVMLNGVVMVVIGVARVARVLADA